MINKNTFENLVPYLLLNLCLLFSQTDWERGNLKMIDELNFKLNLRGIDDDAWGRKLKNYIELRFLENKLVFNNSQMPKMVVDVNIIDSRIEEVSSFLIIFSIYNYSIPEYEYYKSMSKSKLTKKIMTSKIWSKEIMGQTSSITLYKDIERNINKLISDFFSQWYTDNPMKQF